MAGTKMTLRRYGNEAIYWDEQEIIVDQSYIDQNGLYVRLAYPYRMDSKLLEVYLNGQRLVDGGGYEEVSDTTIRLDLGTYPTGHPQAGQLIKLSVGDEIFIKVWKAEYTQTGGGIDAARFARLEEEVINARKFGEGDSAYNTLDDRLDAIQNSNTQRVPILILPKIRDGASDYMLPIPFSGKITAVYASVGIAGTEDVLIRVEKCPQSGIDGSPEWTNIFETNLVIEAGKLSSKTSASKYALAVDEIVTGDHLRLFIEQSGMTAKGLTVEVIVST